MFGFAAQGEAKGEELVMDGAPATSELSDEWTQLPTESQSEGHRALGKHALVLPPICDWGKDSTFWAHYRLLGTHIVSSTRKNERMAGKRWIGKQVNRYANRPECSQVFRLSLSLSLQDNTHSGGARFAW